jgi:arylsulfatase
VQQRDVLLISVDTLRADHMSIYGYERETTPQLQRLFADAAIFTRAHSTESNTPASVASILSGLQPRKHGIRLFYQLLDDAVPILPDYLAETHTTAAFVSNMVLTDEAMRMGSRFDHYDDFVNRRESERRVFERNASDTTDAVLAWLDQDRSPELPVFIWVHYIDPHGPYRPPATWPRSFRHEKPIAIKPSQVPEYQQVAGVTDGLRYVDDYDEEITYMDAEAGRLIAGFGQRRGLTDALVVFTADHGETMMEHEKWFTHGFQVYQALIRVPLLMMGPGVTPGERHELASTVDVLPSILEFAGFEPAERLRGRSLLRPPPLRADRTIFTEATMPFVQWRAAIRGDQKWMMKIEAKHGSPRITERRLYDLANDPGEQNHSGWSAPDGALRALVAEMKRDPDPAGMPTRYAKGRRLGKPKLARQPSKAELEGLRALGYVE